MSLGEKSPSKEKSRQSDTRLSSEKFAAQCTPAASRNQTSPLRIRNTFSSSELKVSQLSSKTTRTRNFFSGEDSNSRKSLCGIIDASTMSRARTIVKCSKAKYSWMSPAVYETCVAYSVGLAAESTSLKIPSLPSPEKFHSGTFFQKPLVNSS